MGIKLRHWMALAGVAAACFLSVSCGTGGIEERKPSEAKSEPTDMQRGENIFNEASKCKDINDADRKYGEAAKHLLKAADGGDAKANTLLGTMYENGFGFKRDVLTAARRYRIGSDKGGADEKRALASFWCRSGANFEDAAKLMREALKLSPDDALCHFTLGMALFLDGMQQEGEAEFKEALRLDADGARGVSRTLAGFRLGRAGEFMRAGNLGGAEGEVGSSLELDPANAESWALKGCIRQARGDSKGALECFDRIVTLKPDDPRSYASRSEIRKLSGDWEGMLLDCEKVVGLAPNDANSRLLLGDALVSVGRGRDALKQFDEAVGLLPEGAPEGLSRRALLKESSGDYRGAERDYGLILESNPSDVMAYTARANVRCAVGACKDAEAEADASKAIELKPEAAGAYVCRANARMGRLDCKGAIGDCDKAIELSGGKIPLAYMMRGYANDMLGRKKAALDDFNAALKLSPLDSKALSAKGALLMDSGRVKEALETLKGGKDGSADFYALRAQAHCSCGELKEALEDASRALKLDEGNCKRWEFKAGIEFDMGLYADVERDAGRALEVNPSSAMALYLRGMARMKLKDCKGAGRDFSEFIKICPNDIRGYRMKAMSSSMTGDYAGAVNGFSVVYGMDGGTVASALDLAEAMIMAGDLKGAEEYAWRALNDRRCIPLERRIALYLQCCSGILRGVDVERKASGFEKELKNGEALGWDMTAFEVWLKSASISESARERIGRLTDSVKELEKKGRR